MKAICPGGVGTKRVGPFPLRHGRYAVKRSAREHLDHWLRSGDAEFQGHDIEPMRFRSDSLDEMRRRPQSDPSSHDVVTVHGLALRFVDMQPRPLTNRSSSARPSPRSIAHNSEWC